jgi:hypothetical protein
MRALFRSATVVATLAASAVVPFACDDTPRGEQGIDFLADGSYYNVPGTDADPDAHGPCVDMTDAAVCAQASVNGVPYDHLVACAPGDSPFDLQCVAADDAGTSDAGAAFCCAGGIL